MKQETLEEAADRLAYDSTEENKGFPKIKAFKDGAKWQAERMYSEEEVLELLYKREDCLGKTSSMFDYQDVKEWFEQFKKQ